MKKLRVGILGGTGIIGQQYVQLLQNHPWFEVSFIAASLQSQNRLYSEFLPLKIHSIEAISEAKKECDFLFSALPNEVALLYEPLFAEADLPLFSHAACHRKDPLIPLLIPEINSPHLKILPIQQQKRGWKKGFIVSKPTCAIQSFMLPLAPLHTLFEIQTLSVTTLQAISGAGATLSSHAIFDNIIPFIQGEEEKIEQEPLKIFGKIEKEECISHPNMTISASCNRVPVLHGHLACVSVSFKEKPDIETILKIWNHSPSLNLPSSPQKLVIYDSQVDRPQVRLDRDSQGGMSATVGRLRPCPLFHYRFHALSHNTIRGGAGGGILTAELLYKEGYLG